MASTPRPKRKSTGDAGTSAGRHRSRRASAVALIVIGTVVFIVSVGVLLGTRTVSGAAPIGAPAPSLDEATDEETSSDESYDAIDPDESAGYPMRAAPQSARDSTLTLADAEKQLADIAEALDSEPTFSELMIESLEDAAEVVTDSLDDAIAQSAAEMAGLLEDADEILDDVRSGAVPGEAMPGTPTEVRAAAALVGAADDLSPDPPAREQLAPEQLVPEPTFAPTPAPAPSAKIELNDYIAMAGAVGGLLTAIAGILTALSEWRRSRRRTASARATPTPATMRPTPSSDLDETIRPS